mgnify:CR=1 FL=1
MVLVSGPVSVATPALLFGVAPADGVTQAVWQRTVGPDGGTFRATERMRVRFAKEVELNESTSDEFVHHRGLNGRVQVAPCERRGDSAV